MEKLFINNEICYTGKELVPHWIYRNHHIQGDAIVGFVGECKVSLDNMVDIADIIDESPIYSKKMVHFIAEHFNIGLIEGVVRQRLLIAIAKDVISTRLPNPNMLIRSGDDLYYDDKKLSVSIATKSLTSVLIHLGINILSENAPVKAAGLKSELNLDNIEVIVNDIINNYCQETKEIIDASCKVRGVI
jgi:hypothetical protein